MLSAEHLAVIESEGRRMVAACRRDPDREVPQYPGWSLADLASHTASVHGRTVLICRQLPSERISAPRLPEGRDPVDWCEETLEAMLAELPAIDPETPAWGFGPRQVVGFWGRRLLVETGVHRWDAEQAFGDPGPLERTVAHAGLDEFPDLWLRQMGEVATLSMTATDVGTTWVFGEGATPTASISSTASDLYLRLSSRPSPVTLPAEWSEAVDSLSPPPKR